MFLSYKYRLYPNKTQAEALDRVLEIHRTVYNDALTERRLAWERCKVSISYFDQCGQLKEIRSFDEDMAWCNSNSLQQTLRRLKKSFDGFFRRVKAKQTAGYPRYKSRRRFRSICYVYNNGMRLKDSKLYVHNIGLIRIFQHRSLPAESEIKSAILKRDNLNCWHVIFQLELPDVEPIATDKPPVGIDMGLEVFAALSTGELIENPRWFRAAEEKLGTLQRRRSRCKRGSRKYKELSRQIRKLHEHTANQRHDFHHKLSAEIVDRFGFVAVESLNIKGLARSHVSKSIGDAGWASFLSMIEYKVANTGSQFVRVDARGTSQYCSGCGCRVAKSLAVRIHNCPHCGVVLNRDVNAAKNVLARAGQARAVKRSEAIASVGRSFPF